QTAAGGLAEQPQPLGALAGGPIASQAQRATRLAAEHGQELHVIVAEIAVALVEQLEHAEDPALALDRRGAERVGPIAEPLRQLARHRALPLRVVDDARDSVDRNLAGDAGVDRHPRA